MDGSVLAILGFVAAFVVLDVAALRFGGGWRSLTRELPMPGEPVFCIPPDVLRHRRAPLTLEAFRERARMNGAWRITVGGRPCTAYPT
jgi:hypothetical protein